MNRIVNVFPDDAHHQLLLDLSFNLAGAMFQQLTHGLKEKLVSALEVMTQSPFNSDLIAKGCEE